MATKYLAKRLFSRKGPSSQQMLAMQKTNVDESEIDNFTLLMKKPEFVEKYMEIKMKHMQPAA